MIAALVDEMIQTTADLCYSGLKAILERYDRFDYGHMWEDICFKNGPLVSPRFFAEKIGPHYRRITGLLREHGIGIVSLDCDGKIDKLVPTWIENGVNTMFPIEVGTWNANIAPWRAAFGRELRGVGGMNKVVFAQDKAAIEAEVERLKPLVELGGFHSVRGSPYSARRKVGERAVLLPADARSVWLITCLTSGQPRLGGR